MKILFVCTGNICRSPTAHALALHYIKEMNLKGFEIDSAGTSSWHAGEKPNPRALQVGAAKGIDFSGIYSRAITKDDFANFDLIFGMDRGHISSLRRISAPEFEDKIQLFLEYADVKNNSDDEVIDPYYGTIEGYETVFELIDEGVRKILEVD